MPVTGVEDAQGAEDAAAWRSAGSALHGSLVGDRHSEPHSRNRRQGRNHRAQPGTYRVLDRKSEWIDRKGECLSGRTQPSRVNWTTSVERMIAGRDDRSYKIRHEPPDIEGERSGLSCHGQ